MGHLSLPSLAPKLLAGTDPRRPLRSTRLLTVARHAHTADPSEQGFADGAVGDLPGLLRPGDLLVLNDSATLPASLEGRLRSSGAHVELRLARHLDAGDPAGPFGARFAAVLFGEGSWRDDTDTRPAPPAVAEGDCLDLGAGGRLSAWVTRVDPRSPRLVEIQFDRAADALAQALFAHGRPVQYSHLSTPLQLEHIQTPFARAPWSMEMPSTGRPLSWALLDALEAAGIPHVFLTHAAGLSATGDPALDAALPLPEVYDVPRSTLDAIEVTRAQGGRVIAVGTSVVRALEAVARDGGRAGRGVATLRIDAGHALATVDGILTGVHSPGESHFDLLHAFASHDALMAAHTAAGRLGYRTHELGDLMLLLRR